MEVENIKHWLTDQMLHGTTGKRFVDVGALWGEGNPGFGESVSTAAKYTSDLTIIDFAQSLWPPIQRKLNDLGISCHYHPIDILAYVGEPFQCCQCCGVIYHLLDTEQLWLKLNEMVTERMVLHSVIVPDWIMSSGKIALEKCSVPLRMKVEHFWNLALGTKWTRPESEAGRLNPSSAMLTVYSAQQVFDEARYYGWKVWFEVAWHKNSQYAMLLER